MRSKGIELSWAGNLASIDVLGLDPVALAQGKPVNGLVNVDASQANVGAILHWWDRLDHQGPPSTNLLPSSSSVSLDFHAQTLTWAGMSCTNLASKAQVSPHRLDVHALTFSALEGTADLRATLKPGAGWALAGWRNPRRFPARTLQNLREFWANHGAARTSSRGTLHRR